MNTQDKSDMKKIGNCLIEARETLEKVYNYIQELKFNKEEDFL